MHRTSLNLQRYVARAGEQVFAPPFTLDSDDMLLIAIKADKKKLDELVDKHLNAPWNMAFGRRGVHHHFRPAASFLLLVVSEVDTLYPAVFEELRQATEPEQRTKLIDGLRENLGIDSRELIETMSDTSASQRELLVMVPIDDLGADPDAGSPRSFNTRQWYLPVVLNDLAPAVIAGRELFGYPKLHASFAFDDKVNDAGKLLTPAKENRRTVPWQTLTISAHAPRPLPVQQGERQRYKLDFAEVLKISSDSKMVGAPPSDAAHIAEQALALLKQGVEFLFLRQFRDPQFGMFASYQAAVTSKVTAASGPITEAMELCEQHFSLEFPKPEIAPHYPGLLDVQASDCLTHDGRVIPCAAWTLRDQKLVVTRDVIEWDKP